MARISIKDIAKTAGVSHSTVSRALSDSPLVNPETKARIQQLARELGYTPDAAARSLVMGRSRTVGVVVTTIADPFIAEVVQGIESTAYEHGYTVTLASCDSASSREIATVEMLRSKRVDSVIVTASRVGALYQDHLERIGVPVVVVLAASAGSRSSTPGSEVAIAVTWRDRNRLARPSTALESWITVAMPKARAAISGGSVG